MTQHAASQPLSNTECWPVKVAAVALDLDGTLLHTAPDLAEAANRMLAELALPPVAQQSVMHYVGNGAASLVKRVLTGSMDGEPEAALFEQAMAVFFRHYAQTLSLQTQPYDGVMEGLHSLQQMGLPLACVTNKPERFTLPLLEAMGMRDFFSLVVSGDSLPRRKPDPLPLLHVCELFGIAPSALAMIGDSAADMQAANAAGCRVFYVPYGYNRGMQVSDFQRQHLSIDAVIANLADVSCYIVKQ